MSLDTRVRDVADQRISAPIALADAGAWPTVIFFIGSVAVPVPTSFLKEAAHPGTSEALAPTLAQNDVESYVVDWPEKFDDVVIFHHGCALNPLPGELVESNRGSFFTMYRVLGR